MQTARALVCIHTYMQSQHLNPPVPFKLNPHTHMQKQVPEEALKYGFGIMMVVLGAKTFAAAGPLRAAAATVAKK